jgi:hypothetical protein
VSRDDLRGRHKGRRSPETKRAIAFLRSTDWLQPEGRAVSGDGSVSRLPEPPPPACPPWLTRDEYELLLELRADLDHNAGPDPAGRSTT